MTKQFDRITATFQPRRTDDLQPHVDEWIGYHGTWEALWQIEPDDNEEYAGMWAWAPRYFDINHPVPFAWVPECDLAVD